MTTDPWSEPIAKAFHELRGLPPAARAERLRQLCGDDRARRRELETLLEHHDEPLELLERPPLPGFSLTGHGAPGAHRDPLIGRAIGPYRLEQQIASGGMGAVYRGARADGLLEQTVAVKLMQPWRRSDELVLRFQSEWQTLANLNHPNIAQLLDAGVTDDGMPYLVMEFIDGLPLDAYCDERALPVGERLALFQTIARTVHFAHQNLVVHRDLKPANIVVTTSGVPKLLDFGIAKLLQPHAAEGEAAQTVTRMMTPDYASPEQLRGEAVTTATDVYSLGVLLYELLCGTKPHRWTTSSLGQIESTLDTDPPRPSTAVVRGMPEEGSGEGGDTESIAQRRASTPHKLQRHLRGDLDNIVMMAMRKDATRRYASAEQLAEDIRRHLGGHPVVARPDTVRYRLRKFVARNRVATAAGILAVVAIAAGTVATAWQAGIAEQERDLARDAGTAAAAEADHARIEAASAQRLAEMLIDAFLVAAPRRTAAETDKVKRLLDRHVIATRREFSGRDHLRANLLDALGRVYLHVDLFDEAEVLIEDAAAIRRATFAEDSLEYALSLDSLGNLAYRRGQHDLAARHFGAALELHRTLDNGVHTDVAKAANNLAVALRLLGRIDEARTLHEEALALRRAKHGDAHRLVAESVNNLAAIHLDVGDLQRAEECMQQVLEIRRASLGEEHPRLAQALNNLASIAFRRRDYDAAERHMRAAIALYRTIPGVELDGLAGALSNLATLLRSRGKTEEALVVAEESLQLHRRRLGSDEHPQVAETLKVLAEIAHTLGRDDEAQRRFAEVVESVRRLYPAGHAKIGEALCNYGTSLNRTRRPTVSEPLLREALEIFRASPAASPVYLATAEFSLGRSLELQQRFAEAEPVLVSAHDRYVALEHSQAAAVAKALVRTYTALDKPELAERYTR